MTPLLIAGPAVEPLTLAEMRLYLRLDDSAEDDLVAALIKAARLLVEGACGRQLIAQTWRLALNRWPPGRAVLLPLSPLLSVARVRVYDLAGAGTDLAAPLYCADTAADPPRVVVEAAAPEPAGPSRASRSTSSRGSGPRQPTCRRRSSRRSASSSRAGSRVVAMGRPTPRSHPISRRSSRRTGGRVYELAAQDPFDRRPRAPFRFGGAAREPGRVRRRHPQYAAGPQIWGAIGMLKGDERVRAGRPEQAVTHRVTMRYRDGVTAAMRLARGLRKFAIRAASDPDGERRHLVCLVEEISL